MTLTLILASTGAIAFMITFFVELTRDARQYDEHKVIEFAARSNTVARPFVREIEHRDERDAEREPCIGRAA